MFSRFPGLSWFGTRRAASAKKVQQSKRPHRVPDRRLVVEELEPRVLLADDWLRVPGLPGHDVALRFVSGPGDAQFRNEVGVYAVQDAAGRVDGLLPSQRGYAAAALRSAQALFPRGARSGVLRELTFEAGTRLAFYLVQNGSRAAYSRSAPGRRPPVFVSFTAANVDRFDHCRSRVLGNGTRQFAWEDLTGGGDRDFNDVVFTVQMGRAPGPQPDVTAPLITALLAHDTAPGGTTNRDGLTYDPAVAGTILDAVGVHSFRAGFDGTPPGQFADVRADLQASGQFSWDRTRLEQFHGGPLADGPHTLHLQARDAAGNLAAYDLAFTLDTTVTPPAFDLTPDADSPPAGDGRTKLKIISLAGQTESGAAVALQGTDFTATADGTGRFEFDGVALSAGANPFTARATDAAGNESSFTKTVTRVCDFADDLAGWTVDQMGGSGAGRGQVAVEDGAAVLREGNSFVVTLQRTFTVPDQPTTFTFEYAGLSFDTTATGAIKDAFEAALLGADGRPLVHTFTAGRDAFFNVTEGAPAALGAGTTAAGQAVTTDISGLTPGSLATLIVRLVNNDGDTETSVKIACVEAPPNDLTQGPPAEPVEPFVVDGSGASAMFALASSSGPLEAVAGETPEVAATSGVLVVLGPAEGSRLAAGTVAIVSGTAAGSEPVHVTINGVPVDAIDPAGNFFAQVPVRPGRNVLEVAATDFLGQTASTTLTLEGTQPQAGVIDFSEFADITASFRAEYARTSFNEATDVLYADHAVRNVGQYAVDTPLLMGVTRLSDPTVRVRDADGVTPDGIPYFDVSNLVAGGTLAPGEVTELRSLAFYNARQAPFTYDLVFLGRLNQAPAITTVPDVEALAGRPYAYHAGAADPDGDPVTFALRSGPDGMAVDAATGVVTWTPAAADIGTHAVTLRVDDGRGGSAEQRYVLAVVDAPPNRPPSFTSVPVVDGNVGAAYTYQTAATDPDGDPLTYSVAAGPAGLTIDAASGLVDWTPTGGQSGLHEVTLQVSDGQGGAATQAYAVQVGQTPGNRPPVIVSDPVTQFSLPDASNPPTGDVDPSRIDLDLDPGEVATQTVSLTLPGYEPVPAYENDRGVLPLGETVARALHHLGGRDRYTFTLSEESLLYFDSLNNNGTLKWTLTGPVAAAGSRTLSEASGPLNLPAGDYLLVVDGAGSYALRLNALDQATPLMPGAPVIGELSPAAETDLYRFDVQAGDRFYFDSEHTGDSTFWRLIDPYGKAVFDKRLDSDVETLTLSRPGTYTLLVEGSNSATGTRPYRFNVQPVTFTEEPLTSGATVSAELAVPGERDVYTFHVAVRSLWYFDSLAGASGLTWTLEGPAGVALKDSSFNLSSGPVFNLVAGDYRLTVDGTGDATGAYQFRVWEMASAAPLTPGVPVSGELSPANETDLYRFTAQAGDRFFFDAQSLSGASVPFWRLVDPYGNSLFSIRADADVGPLTLAQTGTYTLLLEGAFSGTGSVSYTFVVQPLGNVPPSPPGGAPLTLGETVSGEISAAGEQDRYTFTLAADALLAFDSLTNDNHLFWSLEGPAGAAVSNRAFILSDGPSFPSSASPVSNLVAGSYVLTVTASTGQTGAYQFRLWDVVAAAPLTPGTPVSGELSPANETDLYRFTAAAGDRFFFDVQERTGGGSAVWRLIDPYGNSLFSSGFTSTDFVSDVDTLALPHAGVYTLLLEGYVANTPVGSYTFNVQPVSDSTEPLPIGGTVNGAIAAPGEQDRYTFTLAAPSRLYFDSLTNNTRLSWTLEGPAGAVVGNRNFIASDASLDVNPVLNLSAGAYTLTVDGSGDFTGAYQFRLHDLTAAAPLTPGAPVSGALSPANETDLHRFTAQAGDRFFFDVQERTGGGSAVWRLLDAYGNSLFFSGFSSTNSSSDVDTLALEQAGTYTLLLEGRINDTASGSYTFTVQPVSFTTGPLTLGATVSGAVAVQGEQDRYTFALASPSQLYFDSLTNNSNLSWTLEGPAGAVVRGSQFHFSDGLNNARPQLHLAAGAYTLTVDGSGDFTGAYGFRLSDLAATTPLSPGTPVSGTLDPGNETDLYRFTAAAGDRFFFDAQQWTGGSNSIWRLLDPHGMVVFVKNLSSDASDVTLALAGTYTLLVEGYIVESVAGNYTFIVRPLSVSTEPLALGATVNGAVAVPGEEDHYTFTLAADALLTFDSLTNERRFDWTLEGPGGVLVSRRSFLGTDSSLFTDSPALDLAAGAYTLTVKAEGDFTGAYSFRLLDLATAAPLTAGTPVGGTLDPAKETDLYRFTAQAGDRFFFDVVSASDPGGAAWRLIGPFGNQLFFKTFLTDAGPLTLPLAGAYTLAVEGTSANTGADTYTLNVEPQGNEPPPPAMGAPLPPGATVSGEIAVAGEHDVYTFHPAGRSLWYFDSLTNSTSLNWTLEGPAGTVVSNRAFASSDVGTIFFNPVMALVAADYTLTVGGSGSATGAYAFRLHELSAAVPVTDGTPVSGTLEPGNETDLYRFDAQAGDRFLFDSQQSSGGSVNWRLIDPFGATVFTAPFTNDQGTLALTRAGTYTLLVEGAVGNAASATYRFNVQAPRPFALGDVFIAASSAVEHYDSDLNLLQILHTQQPDPTAGMAFDAAGNLFVTNFGGNSITKFDVHGNTVAPVPFVTGDAFSESIAFDADGNMYVGQATGFAVNVTSDILKFSPDGVLLERFDVAISRRGSDWIELAPDRRTIYYTSEWKEIKRYDLLTHTQLEDFARLPGQGESFALRLLPDGGVLVAYTFEIMRLDAAGNVVQRYDAPGQDSWFGFNLDPDGTSFWSQDFFTKDFYQFDIDSGTVLKSRDPGPRDNSAGIVVFGELTAVSRGIDVAASDPAAPFENRTGVVRGTGPGETATFEVAITGDGRAHSFDLLFLSEASGHVLGSLPVTVNNDYVYAAHAIDPDGDVVTYRLAAAPAGATIDAQTGRITWEPLAAGAYQFVVEADDGRGGLATQEYDVTVRVGEPNQAPAITSAPPTQATAGRPFSYAVTATDTDGDLLSFYLTEAAGGMTIDRTTGVVTWAPTAAQIGAHAVTVRVVDGRGGEDAQSFTLSVVADTDNRPPQITSTPSLTSVAGEPYRYAVRAGDPDGDPLQFDLPVRPSGMAADGSTGVVVWTPAANQVGEHDVILRVRDGRGGVDLQPFRVTVTLANTAPAITSLPGGPAVAGLPYQYQVRAQDADADAITFRLDAGPGGMAIEPATGQLTWTPAAGQIGGHPVTIVAADGRGGQAVQSFTLPVAVSAPNHAPAIASTPRTVIGLANQYLYAIEASDPDGDPLAFQLDEAPAGMTVNAAGLLVWSPTATHAGLNPVRLRVEDGRGGTAIQNFVIDAVPQDRNRPPQVVSTPPLAATVGRPYQYNLAAIDPESDPLGWTLDAAPAGMSIDPVRGTLRWTATADQVGSQNVVVRVGDTQGGFATQSFTVAVRAVNVPPVITSAPPTAAAAGRSYGYAIRATDADGDALTFALSAAPAGMTIDAATGLVRWTPTGEQAGGHVVGVRVEDGQGGIATQVYTLAVSATASNRPPAITSEPPFLAVVGEPYQYQVTASDPEGAALTFSLPTAPAGMSIDPAAGLIQWMPAAGQQGLTEVTVVAADPLGNTSTQRYPLNVLAANRAPAITSPPVTVVTAGTAYRYDVRASDPDGDPLRFTLTTGPAGMTLDTHGRLAWSPGISAIGTHHVELAVADGRGGSAAQSFDVTVTADTEAPRVELYVSVRPADVGEPVTFVVSATDDVGVVGRTLTVGGVPVALDATGRVTMMLNTPGPVELVAQAADAAGNTGTATDMLLVLDPADPDAPVVEITAPEAGAVVTAPVDVTGTVNDDNLLAWTLEVAPALGGPATSIAAGAAPVVNGVLGRFDPSLLANDSYLLRLTATDAGGHISVIESPVNVAGELKLGNFRLSFTDLSIPVSGIPITVARTYDTLNAVSEGDFGFGWRLELRHTDVRSNVPPHELAAVGIYNPFRDGTRVYVTLPGGKREGFRFQPRITRLTELLIATLRLPESSWQYEPAFEPDQGVTSRLTLTGANTMIRDTATGEYLSAFGTRYAFNPADPSFEAAYTHTTKDGVAYQMDAATGDLRSVSDRNGNTLTFSADGITSAAGPRVTFGRNPRGRITSVTDPAGKQVLYGYDARGDLVSVTDREGNATQFVYRADPAHYLERVIDPLGRTGVRSEYDAQGRLVRLVNGAGDAVRWQHDLGNSVETVIDPLGNATRYQYDGRGNVVAETDALGGVTLRTYDAADNELTVTDPLGHTTAFTYDAAGNPLNRTDPLGNVSRFTYDTFGNVLTQTDPLGNSFATTYDRQGNITRSADPLGNSVSAAYDVSGNPVLVTDLAGNTRHFIFCDCGSPLQETDPLGHETTYTRDTAGRELTRSVQVTTPAGPRTLVTATTYDAEGRVLTVTDSEGVVTRYEYDAAGNQTAVIDPLGRRTEFHFDSSGRHVETLHPDGTTEIFEYDAGGRRVAAIDRAGRTTRFEYDKLGRLVTTVFPDDTPDDLADNPRQRSEYDAAGRVTAEVDALGRRTAFTYDAVGRQTAVRDALEHVTTTAYDAAGRRVAVTDVLGRTTRYEYDARGLPIRTVYPDGTATLSAFDGMTRLAAVTDQTGATTQFEYDAAGRLAGVVDALGGRTEYGYDEIGNLVRQVDANGHVTRYEYDGLGRRTAAVLPLGQRSATAYDAAGNVARMTDFNGAATHFEYDAMNRLTAKRFPDGASRTYAYTASGQLRSVTDARGTTAYEYDAADRLFARTEPDGRRVGYAYDAAGNRTAVTAPSGATLYGFDALNRLATVTDAAGGVTHYSYDAAGNLTRTELPNATAETRAYDALNRLTSVEHAGPGGVFAGFAYTLSPVGNRLRVEEHGGRQVDYAYDRLYRLTGETVSDPAAGDRAVAYTYDPVGNRLSRDDSGEGLTLYSYDANGRLLSETLGGQQTVYAYDNNGNTLSRVRGATDQLIAAWDFENRLVRADVTGPGGTRHAAYGYDADGVRVAQVVDGQETRYLIDANRPFAEVLEEYAPDGAVIASYVHGRDLISQVRGGAVSFYHADGLGSTRALSDAAAAVTDRYLYDAFGRTIAQAGSSGNAYLFAGEQRDPLTGWDYLRARYLDTGHGRFVSRDPFAGVLQNPVSLQPYPYADLNPVNRTDPSGLWTLAELSVVQGIQDSLTFARLVTSATPVCKLIYLGQQIQLLVGLAFITGAFADAVQEYGLKPGFEFVWHNFHEFHDVKKIAIRIFRDRGDRVLSFALDMNPRTQGGRVSGAIRADINIDNPERSSVSGGQNINLFTLKACYAIPVVKLDLAWRVAFSVAVPVSFKLGLDATFLAVGKLSYTLFDSSTTSLSFS